jgi:tetratricopeptide (TPR) repeat protein
MSETIDVYKRLGEACLAKGEYVKAVEYYKKAIELDVHDHEAVERWCEALSSLEQTMPHGWNTMYDNYGFRTDGSGRHKKF